MKFKLSTMYLVGVVIELILAVLSLIRGDYNTGLLYIVIMNQFTILQRMAEEKEKRQSLYDFVGLFLQNLEREIQEAQRGVTSTFSAAIRTRWPCLRATPRSMFGALRHGTAASTGMSTVTPSSTGSCPMLSWSSTTLSLTRGTTWLLCERGDCRGIV